MKIYNDNFLESQLKESHELYDDNKERIGEYKRKCL